MTQRSEINVRTTLEKSAQYQSARKSERFLTNTFDRIDGEGFLSGSSNPQKQVSAKLALDLL